MFTERRNRSPSSVFISDRKAKCLISPGISSETSAMKKAAACGSGDSVPLQELPWADVLPFVDMTDDELYFNLTCEYTSACDHSNCI